MSAHQRDQLFSNVARDDLCIKEKLFENLTELTMETNKALEKNEIR